MAAKAYYPGLKSHAPLPLHSLQSTIDITAFCPGATQGSPYPITTVPPASKPPIVVKSVRKDREFSSLGYVETPGSYTVMLHSSLCISTRAY